MSRWLLLRRIIAPVMLRYALPAYSTEAILLVKSTALASLVTVWDVTGVAQQIIQRTYRTMEVFLCAAAIYLLLNFIIVQLYSPARTAINAAYPAKPGDRVAQADNQRRVRCSIHVR